MLTGTVNTLFQRVVAEKALRYVRGIKGLVNRLTKRESAERAVMHAPGIVRVENLIAVEGPEGEDPRGLDEIC